MTPPTPLVGSNYDKVQLCFKNNLAVYGSHLPLDCHPEIGNNAILASQLDLPQAGTFLNYEGNDIGLTTECHFTRKELSQRLQTFFREESIQWNTDHPILQKLLYLQVLVRGV